MSSMFKQILGLAISLSILVVIYGNLDFRQLIIILQNCNWIWIGLSLSMAVPIILLNALRLQQLIPTKAKLGWTEATRLILIANTLNMVLPSKMGDIAKAYFIKKQGYLGSSSSLYLVVIEKIFDMLSLVLWCSLGLILYPHKNRILVALYMIVAFITITGIFLFYRKAVNLLLLLSKNLNSSKTKVLLKFWQELQIYVDGSRNGLFKVSVTSLIISFLNFLQIWLLILAVREWIPFVVNLALTPLAVLAGLFPLTFAGIGSRDAAFIVLYQPFFNAPKAAALGLLCTSRYLIPALIGLPIVGKEVLIFCKQQKRI